MSESRPVGTSGISLRQTLQHVIFKVQSDSLGHESQQTLQSWPEEQ